MSEIDFEDVVEDFLQKYKAEEIADVDEYISQFPQYKNRLSNILPLLIDLEKASSKSLKRLELDDVPDFSNTDYILTKLIGVGGMGKVYEAFQKSLGRKVAVKIFAKELSDNPEHRTLFENESKIIAMLHHPNIVKVYSSGICDGLYYYVMDYVDGKSLLHHVTLNIREIARIALSVAKALAYAHSCNILHRDIKPANLLLDKAGNVYVSDFGISQVVEEEKLFGLERESGTLRFMSPERVRGEISSFASDQYSFGVSIYEIIMRQPFIKEKGEDVIKERILATRLPRLSQKEYGDFAAIINKCMSFDASDRYLSMQDVVDDINRYLNNETVLANNKSLFRRISLWTKRSPITAITSLLSFLLLVGVVFALIVGYIRTNAALDVAEKNYETARATLSDIFSHVERATPSSENNELLIRLLEYYKDLSKQKDLPENQLFEANYIIGNMAMRYGDYKLAESIFLKLVKDSPSAEVYNKLADVLRKQDREKEADKYSKLVTKEFDETYEAAYAYQALGDVEKAFSIIHKLLKTNPNNSDYQYRYASLLCDNPRVFKSIQIEGVESNPIAIFKKLCEDNPNNPDYGIALVNAMYKQLRMPRKRTQINEDNLKYVLSFSERLLARFPNMPTVIKAVVELQNASLLYRRRNGDWASAKSDSNQFQGMLELLYYTPSMPNIAKEFLIETQLDKLERSIGKGNQENFNTLFEKISLELDMYDGSEYQKYKNKLNDLEKHKSP